MSEPFIAEIKIFAGNFAPRGYAFCDGQLLPIAQNTALFSLIGTTYGGDGRTTTGLPNLKGRAPASSFVADANSSITRSVGGFSYNDDLSPPISPLHETALSEVGTESVEPHQNMQPYLAMYFIIALTGLYPSRS